MRTVTAGVKVKILLHNKKCKKWNNSVVSPATNDLSPFLSNQYATEKGETDLKSPFSILADFITSRPKLTAAIVIIWFIISMYGMTLVYMKSGNDTYVDKNSKTGINLDQYQELFSSDAIMVIFESDNVLDPETLEYMDLLMADFSNEGGVKEVSGISDMIKNINGGVLPGSQAEINTIKNSLPEETVNRYLPSNMMTIGVIQLETGISEEKQESLLNSLYTIIAISDTPPALTITLSGSPAFSQQMNEEMGESTGVLIFAAMALMIVAVAILFSHVSYRFLPVGIVFTGLINTFGVMGLANIPISMVVIAAFPVLIGIGIDYAIQFHSRIDEEARRFGDIEQAARKTIVSSGPAILYAMIATSLGFIAMYAAPIPMVVDFGLTCLIGVICCYISALLMVPAFCILFRYRPKESNGRGLQSKIEAYDNLLGKTALAIARKPVIILLILGFVAVIGIQLDERVPISFDEETFVPPDMPAVIDMKKVTRTMGSTDSMTVLVKADNLYDPAILKWIDEFGDYEVGLRGELKGVSSIATLIKKYNGGSIPDTEEGVKQVLGMIPDETKQQYISGKMNSVIEFNMKEIEPDVFHTLVDNVKKDLDWNYPPPGVEAGLTGQTDLHITLMDGIREGKTQTTFIGFILIFAWLLLIYRRISAISPIIPIIMIVGWNGAIMYGFGIEYSPMTAVLGSMTIGIASEYTILIMERYTEERSFGKNRIEAIQIGVQKIGTAITVSGLTTVFGFSALLLSSFNIIKNFGMVTVITVGFSLIGAIVVMPAVLSIMGRYEKNTPEDLAGLNLQ